MTAKHGHCTQELLNLMLLGMARSQVFDGIRPVGETGLVLSGVETRPQIGTSFCFSHSNKNHHHYFVLRSSVLS